MNSCAQHSCYLPSPDATTALGVALAPHLKRGDTLLLKGPIGAGKSHMARALIQTRLGHCEDIPSPSFTLVQTYEHPEGDIWHSDLYRLSHPDEAHELGLDEAFHTAICLIEWPDRLGSDIPSNAIHCTLSLPQADQPGRYVDLTFPSTRTDLAQMLRLFAAQNTKT